MSHVKTEASYAFVWIISHSWLLPKPSCSCILGCSWIGVMKFVKRAATDKKTSYRMKHFLTRSCKEVQTVVSVTCGCPYHLALPLCFAHPHLRVGSPDSCWNTGVAWSARHIWPFFQRYTPNQTFLMTDQDLVPLCSARLHNDHGSSVSCGKGALKTRGRVQRYTQNF